MCTLPRQRIFSSSSRLSPLVSYEAQRDALLEQPDAVRIRNSVVYPGRTDDVAGERSLHIGVVVSRLCQEICTEQALLFSCDRAPYDR